MVQNTLSLNDRKKSQIWSLSILVLFLPFSNCSEFTTNKKLAAKGSTHLNSTSSIEIAKDKIEVRIRKALSNPEALFNTITNLANSNMDCLRNETSCPETSNSFASKNNLVLLVDMDNQPLVNSVENRQGFDHLANICTNFGEAEDTNLCNFKVEISWAVDAQINSTDHTRLNTLHFYYRVIYASFSNASDYTFPTQKLSVEDVTRKIFDFCTTKRSNNPNFSCPITYTKGCFQNNGYGHQTWNGSSLSDCELVSCASGFVAEGALCTPMTCTAHGQQACEVENGIGVQTCNANGTQLGSCVVTGCDADFYLNSNTRFCEPVHIGNYSPSENIEEIICTNKPNHSQYTTVGGGQNDCSWECESGYERDGGAFCRKQEPPCETNILNQTYDAQKPFQATDINGNASTVLTMELGANCKITLQAWGAGGNASGYYQNCIPYDPEYCEPHGYGGNGGGGAYVSGEWITPTAGTLEIHIGHPFWRYDVGHAKYYTNSSYATGGDAGGYSGILFNSEPVFIAAGGGGGGGAWHWGGASGGNGGAGGIVTGQDGSGPNPGGGGNQSASGAYGVVNGNWNSNQTSTRLNCGIWSLFDHNGHGFGGCGYHSGGTAEPVANPGGSRIAGGGGGGSSFVHPLATNVSTESGNDRRPGGQSALGWTAPIGWGGLRNTDPVEPEFSPEPTAKNKDFFGTWGGRGRVILSIVPN